MRRLQGQINTRLAQLLLLLAVFGAGSCSLLVPYASASNQKREAVAPRDVLSSSPGQNGSYYLLAIGIKNYRQLKKLNTPNDDAKAIASILHDRYGFASNILLDATRRQILDALDHYRATLHEDDSLLIYYAGHGYYDDAADLAYWAPADAENNSHDDWIVANEITGAARAIPARHVLIISDSCYSGMLARAVKPAFATSEYGAYLQRMMRGKSRNVMASGGKEPVADGDGANSKHSVFANALLTGLQQIRMDNFAAEYLFNQYVREKVAGRSSQMPEYSLLRDSGHEDGDFVFFRKGSRRSASAKTVAPKRGDAGAKSALKSASDPDFILRNFQTMFIQTRKTRFFNTNELKAALIKEKDFGSLNLVIVDDPNLADVVLDVTYTFAWDYPFELKHPGTSLVLFAGKGTGPFSGPVGANSVAKEFVKLVKPYRSEREEKEAQEHH